MTKQKPTNQQIERTARAAYEFCRDDAIWRKAISPGGSWETFYEAQKEAYRAVARWHLTKLAKSRKGAK